VDALRSHVATTRIRCISDLDVAALSQWSDISLAERDGTYILLHSDAPEKVLRRLLDADPALSELEVRRAGLAEAFTELTRESGIEKEAA